ncbi:hypothetical protein SAMN05421832_11074 [Psychrobacillus psychrodurans]|nr:hypothetical protein SAMN05421832_11074 [Psychrobacillus psychrodurans]
MAQYEKSATQIRGTAKKCIVSSLITKSHTLTVEIKYFH